MKTGDVPVAAGGAGNGLTEFEENFSFLVHELQAPLRKVSGFAGLLAQSPAATPEAKLYTERIQAGVARMEELLGALRRYSFALAQPTEPARVDIAKIVEEMLKELGPVIQQAGGNVTNGAKGLIETDPQKLAAIIRELLINALKFRDRQRPRVRISTIRSGKEIIISVSDNGVGMTQEDAARLFVLFRCLPSSAGVTGTGVGLALCRRLAQQCGGRLWVRSKPGKGSIFYLAIPARGKP